MSIELVAVIIATLSLITAVFAVMTSHKGNKIAHQSKDIAANALREAQEANSLSNEANCIAREANQISQRSITANGDTLVYKWVCKRDDKGLLVGLVNDCAYTATSVTVRIRVQGEMVGHISVDCVPERDVILIDVDEVYEKRVPALFKEIGQEYFDIYTPIEFIIRFTTENGSVRDEILYDIIKKQPSSDYSPLPVIRRYS